MLFNSIEFIFAFLPIAYAIFWTLQTANARYVWLTITGYVFYGWWDPRFCLLMAFSTLVSYLAGLGMLRSPVGSQARKMYLVVPITVDLALLGFFKYTNFALDTARSIVSVTGATLDVPHLDIILPIGISFYTFHTISYIVDAYRGTITPTRNFWEFSAYVSLFSQLVAGPIVRFRQIEQDLEQLATSSRTRWLGRGMSFFCIGLVEKVLIADTLAAMVDPSFTHWRELSTGGAWLAVLGYTFQLLFDFSGYSTMAVGLGYMFGIRIPQNFNSPYKSLNPSDFWERWHISLSSCLRDYLYIPLGGNRFGTVLTYRNLMFTMLFGGLWHGASWTFVFWGFYHGLLLCVYRVFRTSWDRLPQLVQQLSMFIAAMVGWVFFRAVSFAEALHILRIMVVPTAGSHFTDIDIRLVLVVMAIAAWWSMRGANPFEMKHEWTPTRRLALATAFGAGLALIVTARPSPFLYFQF
ncbi:MAG TPA: MBOAT family O-acyltransferase [Gemmatimonas sp.]|uniref:MBOAT family O-acyltransferase n=1 Tax=Gemmatimonas sp. TaxID=1962908 RepID=UPI002EDAC808